MSRGCTQTGGEGEPNDFGGSEERLQYGGIGRWNDAPADPFVSPRFIVEWDVPVDTDCVEPLPGLVSWWPGDGDTTDIADGNNGTLQGGATFAPGMVGQAFSLDGIDDFVSVPHGENQNIREALTIEAWAVKQGPCQRLNCFVLAKEDVPAPRDEDLRYGLFIDDADEIGAEENLGRVTLSLNTGSWENVVVSNTVLQDKVWYHIAGTYDGSTAKIYVNGILENSVQKAGFILPSTGGALKIGQESAVEEDGPPEFFNGLIDEVSLYNRALTAEEIAAIYTAGSAGKCKTLQPCTLSLATSFPDGTLSLEFTLGTQEPATWNVWLTAQNEIIRLLSLPLGVLEPPVPVPFTLPLVPPLGTVGILTTLTTPDQGIRCSEFATVETAPISEDVAAAVQALQDVLGQHLGQ